MITIETRIEVSTAALGDIAITAIEGGVNYWARLVGRYDYTRWSPEAGENLEVPDDFVFYRLFDPDGRPFLDDEEQATYDITPELIARGIGLFMRSGKFADDDLAGMDAGEADAVIQFGCFGEVRYG